MLAGIKFLSLYFVSEINDAHPFGNRETIKPNIAPEFFQNVSHENLLYMTGDIITLLVTRYLLSDNTLVPTDAPCVSYV